MRPLALLLVIVLIASVHLHAASQFEGTIVSSNRSMDDGGSSQAYQMTIHVKKSMVRVEVPSIAGMPASTSIYRRDRKVTWMLDAASRTYFEIRTPQGGVKEEGAMGKKEAPVVQRTKKTKKLLGFMCEQVIVTRNDVRTEVWGARGLEDLASVLAEVLGDEQGPASDDVIAAMGLYPLLSTTLYEGRELESQEVIRIERKQLDPSLFEIPNGYTKQKAADVE
jgi:hypothetical protein